MFTFTNIFGTNALFKTFKASPCFDSISKITGFDWEKQKLYVS